MSSKFTAPYRKFAPTKSRAHVRRKACRHSQARPSLICVQIPLLSSSRSSWNGVRIASSVPVEKAYERESTMNGRARATPKSAPPSSGPDEVDAREPRLLCRERTLKLHGG